MDTSTKENAKRSTWRWIIIIQYNQTILIQSYKEKNTSKGDYSNKCKRQYYCIIDL
jgi:hypothetical protein